MYSLQTEISFRTEVTYGSGHGGAAVLLTGFAISL